MNSRFSEHHYRTRLEWHGSTGAGYRGYDRAHRVVAIPAAGDAPDRADSAVPPGEPGSGPVDANGRPASPLTLELTADPAFRGTPDRLNPEQLVLAAASSCQLLSFLAEASLKRVDVLAYVDEASAVMDASLTRPALVSIVLRTRITVASGTDHVLVRAVVEAAHHGCYIANSLSVPMVVEAEVVDGTAA